MEREEAREGGRGAVRNPTRNALRRGAAFPGSPGTDYSLRGHGGPLWRAGTPPSWAGTPLRPAGLVNSLLSFWLREKGNSYFLQAQGFCDPSI